jgi:succinate dehydrogenase / fumarate reductase cytochrome b subunit
MIDRNTRPVFLDLRRIRQPVMALVSVGHRISGIVLFLALAPGLYLLQQALESPQGFAVAADRLATPAARLALVLLAWSLAHHVLAGLRALLLDLHIGVFLARARASAAAVLALGGLAFVIAWALAW